MEQQKAEVWTMRRITSNISRAIQHLAKSKPRSSSGLQVIPADCDWFWGKEAQFSEAMNNLIEGGHLLGRSTWSTSSYTMRPTKILRHSEPRIMILHDLSSLPRKSRSGFLVVRPLVSTNAFVTLISPTRGSPKLMPC